MYVTSECVTLTKYFVGKVYTVAIVKHNITIVVFSFRVREYEFQPDSYST